MTKKSLELANSKLLMAACFTILAVGIYAHVDGWLMKKEFAPVVLGETATRWDWNALWQKIWGRLRYGAKYGQAVKEEAAKTQNATEDLPVESQIERELKNIENEMNSDSDGDENSSYWSM